MCVCVCVCVCVCEESVLLGNQGIYIILIFQYEVEIKILRMYLFIIFTNPSARAGYGTRSIFKWS